jgi:hypothetical protein
MSESIESAIMTIDDVVHEACLAILTTLGGCESADFKYLQSVTGLSRSDLSSVLETLEALRLIEIETKSWMPHTWVQLTKEARTAVEAHLPPPETLRGRVSGWFRRA